MSGSIQIPFSADLNPLNKILSASVIEFKQIKSIVDCQQIPFSLGSFIQLLIPTHVFFSTSDDPRTRSTDDPEWVNLTNSDLWCWIFRIFQQFAVTIFAGPQQAEYKLSWEWEKTMVSNELWEILELLITGSVLLSQRDGVCEYWRRCRISHPRRSQWIVSANFYFCLIIPVVEFVKKVSSYRMEIE